MLRKYRLEKKLFYGITSEYYGVLYECKYLVDPAMSTKELTDALKERYPYLSLQKIKAYVKLFQVHFYGMPITGEQFRASGLSREHFQKIWSILKEKEPIFNGLRFSVKRIYEWAVATKNAAIPEHRFSYILSMYLYHTHGIVEYPNITPNQERLLVHNSLLATTSRKDRYFNDNLFLNIVRALEMINKENIQLDYRSYFQDYYNGLIDGGRGIESFKLMYYNASETEPRIVYIKEPKELAYYIIGYFYPPKDSDIARKVRNCCWGMAARLKYDNIPLKEYFELLPTLVELM